MKLKFKQNIYIADQERLVNIDEEVEIENEIAAQSFIDANYAEEVEEAPKKKIAKKGDK